MQAVDGIRLMILLYEEAATLLLKMFCALLLKATQSH
jgi:hypothetical protein